MKPLALAERDHDALRRVDRDAFQHVGQFDQHVLRERVDRRVGTVELQHQHAVLAAMRAPVAEAEPVEACGGGVGHARTIHTSM
jgi:hypothetical protein